MRVCLVHFKYISLKIFLYLCTLSIACFDFFKFSLTEDDSFVSAIMPLSLVSELSDLVFIFSNISTCACVSFQ